MFGSKYQVKCHGMDCLILYGGQNEQIAVITSAILECDKLLPHSSYSAKQMQTDESSDVFHGWQLSQSPS